MEGVFEAEISVFSGGENTHRTGSSPGWREAGSTSQNLGSDAVLCGFLACLAHTGRWCLGGRYTWQGVWSWWGLFTDPHPGLGECQGSTKLAGHKSERLLVPLNKGQKRAGEHVLYSQRQRLFCLLLLAALPPHKGSWKFELTSKSGQAFCYGKFEQSWERPKVPVQHEKNY